jgi:hypothetical protein
MGEDMLTVEVDEAAGIIRVDSNEFHSVDDVRAYQRSLQLAVAEARRRLGKVRIFVDASRSPVQSAEVMQEFLKLEAPTSDEGDRMAVLVASSLGTLQTRRALKSDREQVFGSESEALAWLAAD